MGEAVEERIPEPLVHKVVHPAAVAHIERKSDVLRLAVKGRRMGNPQLLHMLEAHDGQRRRHHEMHHVRPGRRLLEHMTVGNGQAHPPVSYTHLYMSQAEV